MAAPIKKSQQLHELILQADAARGVLAKSHETLTRALDFPGRIKSSLSEQPSKWLGGSLLAGLATSLFFRKGKKIIEIESMVSTKKKHGAVFGVVLMLFSLFKPFAKVYLTNLLQNYFSSLAKQGTSKSKFF